MKTSMKKILSGLLCFCMMMALVPAAALAAAEGGLCPHHTAHSAELCGFDDTAGTGCAYVCGLCSAPPAPEAEPVDFMQYLEDPILVAFQTAEDIDLHDWLVNAYGLPAEIPFTCSPATVPFGMYEDGSLIPVTVTAGEGYEGSCTVNAEVRYMAALGVLSRVFPVRILIKDSVGNTAYDRSIAGSRDFNYYPYNPETVSATLKADTQYTLTVSYGPSTISGYESRTTAITSLTAGKFTEVSGSGFNVDKNLSMGSVSGLNTSATSGSAVCSIQSDGYGVYTLRIVLQGSEEDPREIDLKLTFQGSGAEESRTSSVPNGSSILLQTDTAFSSTKYNFSWTKNGAPIAGADGSSYTVPSAAAGEVYAATISRKADSGTGCTGGESWTHTFIVTNETLVEPKALDNIVYNGSAQKIFADGSAPAGYSIFYYPSSYYIPIGHTYDEFWTQLGGDYVNPGTYTIHWYISTDAFSFDNTIREGTMSCRIGKALPVLTAAPTAVSGLQFDGSDHELVVAGRATDGTLQYRVNGGSWSSDIPTARKAGTYTVEYRVAGKNANYETLTNSSYTLSVTIRKAAAGLTELPQGKSGLVYSGQMQDLLAAAPDKLAYAVMTEAAAVPQDGDYSTAMPQAGEAGIYYVWYRMAEDWESYDLEPTKISVAIAPADLSGAMVTLAQENMVFTNTECKPTVAVFLENFGSLAESIDFNVLYSANIGVGTAKVTVTGRGNFFGAVEKDFRISYLETEADAAISGLRGRGDWYIGDVTLTAPEGFAISKTADGSYSDTIVCSTDQSGEITYYLQNEATGEIARKTRELKLDKTAPTGEIRLNEQKAWQQLIETITFGLFYNYEQSVTVTAGDALSGVASTEYLEAASGLDMTALAAAQWTEYTGVIPVTLEDARRFVYYAKITDAAGNVSYLSTDGTTYDTTAPSIAGVTEGEICYITKSVTVSDANLQTVTLKTGAGTPQEMTASFDLPGNADTVYTIGAKDKAGNVTTVTVTMKPVEVLDDALDTGGEAMTADNVTLADEPAITAIRDQAEDLMDETDVPAEDAALLDIVDRMDALLDAIEEAKGVIELIDALPDTAQPDSEEHIAAWQAAQDAFDDKCYDDAGEPNNIGAMVGPEKKAALDAFGEALRDYRIIAGNGASWTKGSSAGLSLTANGLFAKFTGIEVDGVAVDAANYTAESGSTILCLQKAYLNSLSTGEHSIRILYTDGEAAGSFRIQAAPTVPSTGDHSHVELWIGALCLCALGFAAVLAAARRRRSGK